MSDAEPHMCGLCRRVFNEVEHLRRHTTSEHGMEQLREHITCNKEELRDIIEHDENKIYSYENSDAFSKPELLGENMVLAHGIIKEEKEEGPVVITGSLYLNQFACRQENSPKESSIDDEEELVPCKGEIDDVDYEPEAKFNDTINNSDDEMMTSEEEEETQTVVRMKEELDVNEYYDEFDDEETISEEEEKKERQAVVRVKEELYDDFEHEEKCDEDKITTSEENGMQAVLKVKEEREAIAEGQTDFTDVWNCDLECMVCMLICDTRKELRDHVKSCHQPDRNLVQCSKKSTAKIAPKTHRTETNEARNGETPFECDICGQRFSAERTLRRHHGKVHSNVGPYTSKERKRPFHCDQCGKDFMERSDLNKHLKIHSGDKPHQCTVCGKGFILLAYLRRHENIHLGNKSEFLCNLCGKKLSSSRTLKAHMALHTDEKTQVGSKNEFLCNLCGKPLSSRRILKAHLTLHTDEKEFRCTHCEKSYNSRAALDSHMLRHIHGRQPREKIFQCTKCDRAFSDKRNLEKHIQYHAEGLLGERGQFSCEKCGKEFRQKDGYVRHKKTCVSKRILDYREDGSIECEVCKKIVKHAYNMKIHMRTHTGERPYVCDVCSKSYKKSYLLEEHMRTHTGEKPFVCGLCGRAFARHLNARVHLRTNHGIDKYTRISQNGTKKYLPKTNNVLEMESS